MQYAGDGWGGWVAEGGTELFGCLPPESGGSALQCNGWRSTHATPKTIACCFDDDFCNLQLHPPPANLPTGPTLSLSFEGKNKTSERVAGGGWYSSPFGIALLALAGILSVAALLFALFCYIRVIRGRFPARFTS